MQSLGHFPSQPKISRVIPLFKTGDPELFSNYRPISLLSSLSKIFEQVIFNQLFNYMNNNKLLCLEQYGFRPGHSTELAALKLVNTRCTRGVRVVFSVTRMRSNNSARINKSDFTTEKIV